LNLPSPPQMDWYDVENALRELNTRLTALESRQIWTWNMGWTGEVLSIGEWTGEVYHVPQPQSAPKPTILPNRTITTETILGTESAAKAVEQGAADVVEGRTRQVDSLDQLAAEAQEEGEHGTAWERWVNDHPPAYEWDLNPKSRTHVKDRFNAFVAAREKAAVDYYIRTKK
jgi:hypothetical protein